MENENSFFVAMVRKVMSTWFLLPLYCIVWLFQENFTDEKKEIRIYFSEC